MRFPREFIDQVKKEVDIVGLINEYTPLKKVNSNMWQGECPNSGNHADGNDSTPSFTVYENYKSFYCYGCGIGSKDSESQGSDAIGFLMWMEGFNFEQSVMELARRLGIPLSKEMMKDFQKIQELKYITDQQVEIYHEELLKDEHMLKYLYDRGLGDKDIELWRLGKVPQNSQFPEFRNRLAFPVFDVHGSPVGFGFRAMQGESPKYINNYENLIWKKGKELYGIHRARRPIMNEGFAVLCEGFTDVILLNKYGIFNSVASMGTSLTDDQVKLLKSYTDEVVMFVDNDGPGETAASRHIQKLRAHKMIVNVITAKPGLDPADIVNEVKSDIKCYIEENMVIWSQFEIGKILNKYNSEWIKLRVRTLDKIEPILKELDANERGMYMNIIKDILEVRPWNETDESGMARTIKDIANLRK